MAAEKQLPQPKVIDVAEVQAEKSQVGKLFKQEAKTITGYLEKLTPEEVTNIETRIKEATKYC